jgi:hypothetical protein
MFNNLFLIAIQKNGSPFSECLLISFANLSHLPLEKLAVKWKILWSVFPSH